MNVKLSKGFVGGYFDYTKAECVRAKLETALFGYQMITFSQSNVGAKGDSLGIEMDSTIYTNANHQYPIGDENRHTNRS